MREGRLGLPESPRFLAAGVLAAAVAYPLRVIDNTREQLAATGQFLLYVLCCSILVSVGSLIFVWLTR